MHHRILRLEVRQKGHEAVLSTVGRSSKGMTYIIANEAVETEGKSKQQVKTDLEKAAKKLLPKNSEA